MTDLTAQFAARLGQLLGPEFPGRIALAVSGGGDSMAMLHLAAGWARPMGIGLQVVTVDHGLRAESAAEAALVAQECAGLGLTHTTLPWTGWDGQGNLQDAARAARLRLIGAWQDRPRDVLFAHTQDDQAETLLLRLARGSGVDGLSAMAAIRDLGDWRVLRPLLTVTRADLRHYLGTLRIPFVDDPSNDNPDFARVRVRGLIGQEGLSTDTLSRTAQRLARAREALDRRAADAYAETRQPVPVAGALGLNRTRFAGLETESQLRILAAGLNWLASATYRPRETALLDMLDRVLSGGTATLHGGVVLAQRDRIYLAREGKAAHSVAASTPDGADWDGRWRVFGPKDNGLDYRRLGHEGLAQLRSAAPDHWVRGRVPEPVLLGLPALWRAHDLLACPPLGYGTLGNAGLNTAFQMPLSPLLH